MVHVSTFDLSKSKIEDFSNVEKLYRIYGRYAFGLAKKVFPDDGIAEDVAQEAFLRYWKEPALYTLKSASFFVWLLGEVQQICHERIPGLTSLVEPPTR